MISSSFVLLIGDFCLQNFESRFGSSIVVALVAFIKVCRSFLTGFAIATETLATGASEHSRSSFITGGMRIAWVIFTTIDLSTNDTISFEAWRANTLMPVGPKSLTSTMGEIARVRGTTINFFARRAITRIAFIAGTSRRTRAGL